MNETKRVVNNYVDNKQLTVALTAYVKSCEHDEDGKFIEGSGDFSNELGEMILLIAKNLSNKGNFANYTWKDDMVSEAILTCVKYCHNYNYEKSSNGFSYITQICRNAFINYIQKQNRHSTIKDTCYNRKDLFIDNEQDSYTSKSIDYSLMADKK